MSKELENIVDQLIAFRKEEIISAKNDSTINIDDFCNALKEKLIGSIYTEIASEIREEEKQKAREEFKEEIRKSKLYELKKLIGSGIIIAFLVGLLVNQVTNLIAYGMGDHNVTGTIILSIILAVISFGLTSYFFLTEGFRLLKESK